LKKLMADLSLDKQMLQDVAQKKVAKLVRKRRLVDRLALTYRISTRQAFEVVGLQRSVYYYKPEISKVGCLNFGRGSCESFQQSLIQ
jgi:hypothetical protein